MRQKLYTSTQALFANPLFGGSAIMLLGTNLANFFAYVYHFVFGRMLGKDSYGELVAFLSLLALLSASYTFINLVVVKFVSVANKKEQQNLLSYFSSLSLKFGLVGAIVVLLLTPLFVNLLHMSSSILIMAGPIFLFGLLTFVYRSFLQGLLKFSQNVVMINVELFGRLILGLMLVIAGFGVFGTALGILLALLICVILGRYYLKSFSSIKKDISFKPNPHIKSYALIILINTIAMTSLLSSDILLTKHFFLAGQAGIFAAVATLGKTILFASVPISAVMFPIISKRHSQGKPHVKVFLTSLFMTVGLSVIILIVFLLLPDLAITILYGRDYLEAADYLFLYGVFISLFAINTLFINYFLSRDKNRVIVFSLTAAIIQIIGILSFHNSLYQIIQISILSSTLMLVLLLIYFVHETKAKKSF